MPTRFLIAALTALFLALPCAAGAQYAQPQMPALSRLPSLAEAAAQDSVGPDSLSVLLAQFSRLSFEEFFGADRAGEKLAEKILFRWAGADGIDPWSRGPNIDARALKVIEAMEGQPFIQVNVFGRKNPLFMASLGLNWGYLELSNRIYASLAAQAAGRELFAGDVAYDAEKGRFTGITGLNTDRLLELAAVAEKLPSAEDRVKFWAMPARIVLFTIADRDVAEKAYEKLHYAIVASDPTLSFDKVLAAVVAPHPRDFPGSHYAGRVLGMTAEAPSFIDLFRAARKKSGARQIVMSDVATEYLQACCGSADEIKAALKRENFYVEDSSKAYKQEQFLGRWRRPYPQVLRASFRGPIYPQREFLGYQYGGGPSEFIYVVVFMKGGKADWAYAHIQKER